MKLKKRKRPARIEMLPLMDIVFLLLVFFIYSMLSMALHRSLPLQLPVSSTAQVDTTVTLALTVKGAEEIYLDKAPVALNDLAELLKAKLSENPADKEPVLQVFAENDLSYQELFKVLDQVKLAKVKKISLQAVAEKSQ